MSIHEMKAILLTCGSFALSAAVVGNAFYQKKQFYPSVVYITKSNPSMAILYLQAFVFIVLMGKLFRKIFFGQLRAAEMEHLIERSWYAVTETCLAFTVFRDDFSPKFVAAFTLLLFLKCFHWLAEDRVDYMERSPVISYLFHIRVVSLLTFLSVVDAYSINYAYYSTLSKGASVQLVFGFESENPWENKAVYLLYSELILGFVKVILYMMFMVIMIKIHTFPLFAIRPMYLSVRNFKKSLHDVIMSRRAISQMNTLYPNVTEEELAQGDNVCIICREDMVTTCKKLPCGHIFHTSCLRSWFQRQQTCPTCRMEVLRMAQPRPQAPPPPQQPQPQNPFQNMFGAGMPPAGGGGFPGMPPMWPPQQAPPMQAPPTQATPTTTQASQPAPGMYPSQPSTPMMPPGTTAPPPTPLPGQTSPTMPPFMPGMFPPMFMPYSFPRPPTSMSGLTAEELLVMEGTERENVEARVQWLRDIQALLDGAMVLMQQYNTVAASSSIPGINVTARPEPTTLGPDVRSRGTAPSPSTYSPIPTPTAETGARPKYSSPTKNTLNSPPSSSNLTQNTGNPPSEGASGFTPTTDEYIPEWEDPRTEEHVDGMDEVRRRRLEKFLSDSSSKDKCSQDNQSDTGS
ncbi:SYVNB-like protein [Mya arenaria]|uniref:RING-type E3 ubiquitin transferase n=1 Tax=Mya arenaria TaxID=6604 RepID=A0ABY7FCT2_MYAAR|nr:SYVNB-like protein [Mya arenaria]